MRRSCGRLIAVLFFTAFVVSSLSFAQKVTGTITGVVTDPTNAVVPDATVTAKNVATGATRTTKTDANGVYTFPQVDVGDYAVTVTKEGFKTTTQKDVALHVATTTAANVQLQVGSASDQVEVEANAVQVNTENGTVGNVMEGEQVRELPMNGRNFVQLTTLIPGASVSENFDNKNKGLLAGVDISFSGASSSANQWLVDGANNNDIGSQRTILIYPSIDGIEEFKILRNSYGPEFGGAGGAQINVVTKGGGNQFHGDAYYFGRNAALNAKNYFLGLGLKPGESCTPSNPNYLSCKKQKLQRNDFGYTIGGPIKKDKVFFFWSEEWNRERRGVVRKDQVLTAQELQGNFNDLVGCPAGSRALPNNPATHAPFAGNQIPSNLISPGGSALLSMFPLPTISDPCANPNWVAQVNVPLNWREENIRGDWNITKSTSLMIRYAQDSWVNPTQAYEEGGLWGSQVFPAVNDSWSQPGKQAVAKLTTSLGTTAVNDFQFSWSANRIIITPGGSDPSLRDKILAAVPTVFPTSNKLHNGNEEIPVCWCGSNSPEFGTMAPWHNRQDLFTWKDDFSKVVGNHTFKLGVLYDRNAKDEEAGDGSEAGQLWGVGGYQSAYGGSNVNWNGSTGNLDADLLLKGTLWGGAESARNTISTIRWRDYEFYFGDTWKLTRTFTLDYGFRWSFIRPEFMADNLWSEFVPSAYNPVLKGDPCNGIVLPKGAPNLCSTLGSTAGTYASGRNLWPANNHAIAPRVGFAWDVFGDQKFVLRAGAGQFFARDPVGLAIVDNQANPPFGISAPFYRALDGPLVPGVSLFDGGGTNNIALGGVPTTGFEQNTNLSNSWQWNVTTESQLWKDAKLELGWVGLRGIHLQSTQDLNEIAPANRVAYIMRGITNSGDNRADLYPLGAMTTGNVSSFGHRGDSIYHSLQAMFSTKFHRNSIFQTSYTWSKNIADVPLGYNNGPSAYIDTYNTRASRGLANFDRRHVFNASFIYNLPGLEGANGFVKAVAGGWETSTILQLASGPGLDITGTLTDVLYNGNLVGFNPWGIGTTNGFTSMPDVTSAPCHVTRSASNPLAFLNPAHFTYSGYVIGGPPNSGIGQCSGPGTEDLDFALDKNWVLPFGGGGGRFFAEHPKLQFRLETFNLLNHPMFRFNGTNLGVTIDCADVGTRTNCPTLVGNTIQGGVLQKGSNFGQLPLASNIGNREIQFALKFIF